MTCTSLDKHEQTSQSLCLTPTKLHFLTRWVPHRWPLRSRPELRMTLHQLGGLEHCFTVEQVDLSGAMLDGMLPQESWGIYYIVVYLLVNVYITTEITIFHG